MRSARRAVPALAAAAVLLPFLSGCAYHVSERQLFHPKRLPELSQAVHRRNVSIAAADGTTLRGWYLDAPGSRAALLWFYGNGETVFESAPLLYRLAERLEADVLAVDYRGYGFSDGEPSLAGIGADAPLLYDLAARLAGPGTPVIVIGRSLGSAFALRVARERPAAGLILASPASTIHETLAAWERLLPWYLRPFVRLRPDRKLGALGPQPIEDAAGIAVPLLVVHGGRDTTVPPALGRAVYERAGSREKRFCEVAGAGHNDLDLVDGVGGACILEFVSATLSAP